MQKRQLLYAKDGTKGGADSRNERITAAMKTEKLWINSNVRRNMDAEEIVKTFAEEIGIRGKDTQHMSLLVEETLGMANQLIRHFDGEIWLEETAEGYDIILEAEVRPGEEGAPGLAGAPEGFMAKIAEMLNCSYMFENIGEMPEELAGMVPDYMSYGMRQGENSPVFAGRWSLTSYRYNLESDREAAEPVLDELEKSIVARLADEVTIGIHGSKIRLVISKKVRR